MSERTLFEEVLDEGIKERMKRVRMGEIFSLESFVFNLKDKGFRGDEVIRQLEDYIINAKSSMFINFS